MKRTTALVLALGLLLGLASGPMAQPTRAGSLKICGEVTVYVKPTILATGLLTINAVPLVVAAGVNLPASVEVGADLCLDLTTNVLGLVTGAVVTANVHASLKLCGTVVTYVKATATATGLLRIGSRTLTLAVGSHLPASVVVGANLCVDLELDAFGRVSDGEVSANVQTHLKICGKVTAFAAATATSAGSIRIAGRTLAIAVNEDLPAIVKLNADLCLDLTLNAFGQISKAGAVANVEATLDVCGQVTVYAAATSNSDGSLTIGGIHKVIAAGADLDAAVHAQAYLKLRLKVDVFGRISKVTVLKVAVSVADACGTVAPNPTQEPGATTDPGATPVPGGTDDPGATDGPDGTDDPNSTPVPGASDQPDPSDDPNPQPTSGVGVDDCTTGGGNTDASGTLLPDTDSLGRAAGVVATNAIPLIAIGLLGGFAYWYRARRNRESELDVESAPGLANASPIDPTTEEVGA